MEKYIDRNKIEKYKNLTEKIKNSKKTESAFGAEFRTGQRLSG